MNNRIILLVVKRFLALQLIIESDNPEGSKKDEIPVADEVMEAMEEEG